MTNVIKWLLQQPREWNISTAWKALISDNNRLYTLSDDDAIVLQRKLEYREGTPQFLAEEARRLAKRLSRSIAPKTWPLVESHAARLARDILAEPLRKSSGATNGTSFYATTFERAELAGGSFI